jgi:hypothetical protein
MNFAEFSAYLTVSGIVSASALDDARKKGVNGLDVRQYEGMPAYRLCKISGSQVGYNPYEVLSGGAGIRLYHAINDKDTVGIKKNATEILSVMRKGTKLYDAVSRISGLDSETTL